MSQSSVEQLVAAMHRGEKLPLARLITKIESRDPDLREIMKCIYPQTGRAEIWGITGPPGAGKSTLVDALVKDVRAQGKTVAVVAIDPSSPFSGGALLGDRIRMQKHATDEGVFIRSLGTRGKHGGLSHATKEVVLCLDSAGFDVVLVETAGVGQTELDILTLAQTVIVVLVPESGDSIQMMKAGLMEIADVFAVNKSDRPGADKIIQELHHMISMAHVDWKNPVIKTEALHHRGVADLLAAIQTHQEFLTTSGVRKTRYESFLKSEVIEILMERLEHETQERFKTQSGARLITQLLDKKSDPYAVADQLLLDKTQ